MLTIRYNLDSVNRTIKAITDKLGSGYVVEAAQRGLHQAVARFYTGKGSTFYARFSPTAQDGAGFHDAPTKTTAAMVLDDKFNAPILIHKYKGGPIYPRNGKRLAIPLTPAARKAGAPKQVHSPELFCFKNPKTGKVLLARKWKGRAKKYKPLQLWYVLVESVMQKPHPDALPDEQYIKDATMGAVTEAIQQIFR